MRRYLVTGAALVLLAGLILTTTLASRTTDSSALGRARPVSALPTTTVGPPVAGAECTAAAPAAPAGTPDDPTVVVAGACTGQISGRMVCADGDDEIINGSVRASLADGRHLTLTVVVPGVAGPGQYDDLALYAQVDRAGGGGAERWSDRAVTGDLDDAGVITLQADLSAEPGTRTLGEVSVGGALRCS